MRLYKEKERAMSDNKEKVAIAQNEINALVQGGAKISVANKDTFYLYSTDKTLLATIDLFQYGQSKPKYTIFIDGLPTTRKFDKSNDECKRLYNYVNRIYNFDSMLDQDINKRPFVLSDMQEMWKSACKSKSIEKEQGFLNDLVIALIQRKCPIRFIHRTIYCFEKGVKHDFPKEFTVLNSLYKLVEYKTLRDNVWFYTGTTNSTGAFVPMDKDARKMFEGVKIALKNQKQNVK